MAFQFDVFSYTQWIAMITGSACMWSACIVALCFFAFPELRSAWRLYVLFLSLADFLQGLYYTLDGAGIFHDRSHEGTLGCKVFAFIGIWSACSSFIWSACVSAYVTFFLTRHMRRAPRQQRATPLVTMLFCFLSFGYPTVVLVLLIEERVPLSYNLLSEDANGGFVDRDEFGWRLVSIYGPLWLSMSVVTACSLVSLMQLRAHVHASDETKQQRNLRQLRRRMLAIPLIFVLCRLPETIYRCVEWSIGPHASGLFLRHSALSTALKGLLAFTNPAQGIATAVIFVWTSPAYRRRLYQLWLRACGCSRCCLCGGAAPAATSSVSSYSTRAPLLPASCTISPASCTISPGPGVAVGAAAGAVRPYVVPAAARESPCTTVYAPTPVILPVGWSPACGYVEAAGAASPATTPAPPPAPPPGGLPAGVRISVGISVGISAAAPHPPPSLCSPRVVLAAPAPPALPPVSVISPSTARRALSASFAAAALLGSPRRRATANEGDTESADTDEYDGQYDPLAAELAAEEALETAFDEALAASPPGGVHVHGGVSLRS